jgi:hypothetical protein
MGTVVTPMEFIEWKKRRDRRMGILPPRMKKTRAHTLIDAQAQWLGMSSAPPPSVTFDPPLLLEDKTKPRP